MAPRLSLLFTGATGMVGSALYRDILHGYRCTLIGRGGGGNAGGAGRKSRGALAVRRGDQFLSRDLAQPGVARALVESCEPEVVVHAAAVSGLGACEEQRASSEALNVAATAELARACAASGTYLVFCSTDQVFSGDGAPYSESAEPSPLSAYGRQKAAAESAVLDLCQEALVLRLALVLGPSVGGATGPIDMLRQNCNEPVGLFADEWRTPIGLSCLGRLIRAVLDQRPSGVLNAGGSERIDRWELGVRICAAYGWEVDLVQRSRHGMSYPRPEDVSLELDGRRAAGLPLPSSLDEVLRGLVAREKEGRG